MILMKSLLLRALDWMIPFGLVLGFFWLQVHLQSLASGPLHDALMAVSLIVEIRLIWLWERWSYQRALA
jgi:hypothetical protein